MNENIITSRSAWKIKWPQSICRELFEHITYFNKRLLEKHVMRGRKVWSINTTSLERCYILIMKLHVSAYNGHLQVSTVIRKSLFICVRVC